MYGLHHDPDLVAEARKVCYSCPVQTTCLLYALGRRERFGVWGGLDPGERTKLLAEIRRGESDGPLPHA
jgi:hypothetical protein